MKFTIEDKHFVTAVNEKYGAKHFCEMFPGTSDLTLSTNSALYKLL